MKTLLVLILLLSSSCILLTVKFHAVTEHENEMQAEEFFFNQRNWPDAPDAKAYLHAMNHAQQLILSEPNRSATNWQVEGPTNIGGRVNCIAAAKGNNQVMYAGCPQGGIFKTVNGGSTWLPCFDDQPFLSIGAITIDPSNEQTVWAGTGDLNISGYPGIGNGIYKSADAGNTWTHMGLTDECIVSKIIVDPTDSQTVYAATMGVPFVRNSNRGLYKTTDGGTTWNQVLYIDSDAGIIDLTIDPTDPQTLFACSWNRIRNNHESVLWGPDTHIYKTTDGGSTWNVLSNGLPQENTCRIDVAISQQNHLKLYAMIVDTIAFNARGIYKSVDGGLHWNDITNNFDQSAFGTQGWYHGKIYVNPTNDNQIYVPGVDMRKSFDGGATWTAATPPWWQYSVHADGHYIEFIDGNTFFYCTDGGVYKTTNNCNSWTDGGLMPNTEFYHVCTNIFQGDEYFGGAQDNGTTGGNHLFAANWPRIYGGDGFQPWYDQTHNNISYTETQNGGLSYSDDGQNSWYSFTNGIDAADRISWDMPYYMNPSDNSKFLCGTNHVYEMDGAPYGTWNQISPDLTDGLIYDPRFHVITCVGWSALNLQYMYAGTSDGNVWYSSNAGANWNNVSSQLPDRYVTSIHASPNVAANVYVTHSGYKYNDFIPHVHMSTDNGQNWTDISGDLPDAAANDICVYPGTTGDSLIFVATDAGVYSTTDGGTHWIRVGANMPVIPVYDIEVNTYNSTLVAGTFARGIWTMDLSVISGMQSSTNHQSITLFPNPATTDLNVSGVTKSINYKIFSIDGKVMVNGIVNSSSNKVDIRTLPSGIYFLEMDMNEKTEIEKFVKQ